GLRNILIHQLDDYANDLSTDTQTLVTIYGKERVYHQTLKWILPLELVFLFLFLTTLGARFNHVWIFCLIFIFIYRFGHGIFTHLNWNKENHTKNTYLFILNDFYEMYLPFYFLLSFCFKRPEYILFLIIHILLFPSILPRIKSDFSRAIIEFINYIKNYLLLIYRYFNKEK
ncbi:MAG: hypothetical protein LC105_01140, partial [Chitinophagales bacterium]|nr:hypothetical protein [Chitinophagales bacterium]